MKSYVLHETTSPSPSETLIDYQAELNSQQYNVVSKTDGPQLVIAGAGTGKTRTLVYRVAYLIEQGTPPSSILLLTFTRKAAREMMVRSSGILDNRCSKISGGTFHSFGAMLLRKYGELIGYSNSFTIVDSSDSADIINLMRTHLGYTDKEKRFPKKRTLLAIISKSVNTRKTILEIINSEYDQFYEQAEEIQKLAAAYGDYKKVNNMMDYDDLLVNTRELLRINSVRIKLSNQYRYIMVDEYQDTNLLQAEIACLLASEHGNIMVVGDDAQSIYSFRGANFKNIMDFPRIFENCAVNTIEQNYRSVQPILDFTNSVIKSASEKYEKELFSEIAGNRKPCYVTARNQSDEARFISQKVLELREQGVELQNIAVLFRSAFHSNQLEVELTKAGIPYVKWGGIKFAESSHVKDVLAYLRVLYNPTDVISWLRILLLIQGIGAKTGDKILGAMLERNLGLEGLIQAEFEKKRYFSHLRKLYNTLKSVQTEEKSIREIIETISEYYIPLLKENYKDDYKKRLGDLETFINIAEGYKSLEQIVTDMVLEPPLDARSAKKDDEDENLILSTIHSAKGLEWHTVFVIHLVQGYFPVDRDKNDQDLEEERRIFYVACTRARENLFLIKPNIQGRGFYGSDYTAYTEHSKFIQDMDDFEQLIEDVHIIPQEHTYFPENEKEAEGTQKSSNSPYANRIMSFFDK